jgi:hypothetical protein
LPPPLSIPTAGGPQKINCANTEGIFRIVQSIPSPKTEPFKRWLAKVGYERIQEIENPELATKRSTTEIHRNENSKGMPKLKADAQAGGDIAGGARKKLEKRLGRSVVSRANYLKNPQNKKLVGK